MAFFFFFYILISVIMNGGKITVITLLFKTPHYQNISIFGTSEHNAVFGRKKKKQCYVIWLWFWFMTSVYSDMTRLLPLFLGATFFCRGTSKHSINLLLLQPDCQTHCGPTSQKRFARPWSMLFFSLLLWWSSITISRYRPQWSDVAGLAPVKNTRCRWQSPQESAARAAGAPTAASYQSVTAGINTQTGRTNDSSGWTNAGPPRQDAFCPSAAGFRRGRWYPRHPRSNDCNLHALMCFWDVWRREQCQKYVSVRSFAWLEYFKFSIRSTWIRFFSFSHLFLAVLIHFTAIFVNLLNSGRV